METPVSVVDDRESLVAELRARGIGHLAPSDAARTMPLDDDSLLASLAAHGDPRLRQSLIALFLVHPDLATRVPALRARLDPPVALDLATYYSAAVFLQRMWSIRLKRTVRDYRELPDVYSHELGLPPASQAHGKPGLHALAEWHAARSPYPFNRLGEYHTAAEHAFWSLEHERSLHGSATAS
jgi:hypothetical protein